MSKKEGFPNPESNPEDRFRSFWKNKAEKWLEEIEKSIMDPISKTRLKTFIEISFIKAYVNNSDRPSISIFTEPIHEEIEECESEDSSAEEKTEELRIYQIILNDVRDLYIDPKNN